MKRQPLFFSIVTAALFAAPAFAATDGITGIQWGRNSKDFDAMLSGPKPLRNLNRDANGVADDHALVGDYRNPILTPYAAAIVKQKGEEALGAGFTTPKEQCRPLAPPFSAAIQFDFQILQKKDGDLAIVYHADNQVRHIRMNGSHPAKLAPAWMGDSIGHWEEDTLVIDTVGVKSDKLTMVDRFGIPLTEAIHVVERYRPIDGARAKEDLAKYEESEGVVGGRTDGYNPDTKLTGLRLEITMEDPKVFTAPLTGVVTYRRLTFGWREDVCADNPVEHYKDEWVALPVAGHPDF